MLNNVLASLQKQSQAASQLMVLEEILKAFEGRVEIPMPTGWPSAYDALVESDNEIVRERADQIAILLGDKRIFPRMRELLTNREAKLDKRRQALAILVRGRDSDGASAFQSVLNEPSLRGAAIRALAAVDDPKTPALILCHYDNLTSDEQHDAIATLVARPTSAMALLDAMSQGKVRTTDVHAYHVRQLQRFKNAALTERIVEVWGAIRETSEDKKQQIEKLKAALLPQQIAAADLGHGRQLFSKNCASCHTLFGEGGKVGPDITGSNRANLDYILENVIDPSAVLGKDYRMTIIATTSGRVVSGLVEKETDSAVTLRTLNDTVVIAKSEIDERHLSKQSLMPEQLLDQLKPDAIRDLIGYLASPTQVALRGPKAPIDPQTKRVPGAIEFEGMKIVSKTAGDARSQPMSGFKQDRWSGDDHLWWTGAKPGARLELELPVEQPGRYQLEVVFTMARDYGIVQLSLDGKRIGGPVDLFNTPDVITTGVLKFGEHDLKPGAHRLGIEIVGANPNALKSYMCGLDFVRLTPLTVE
jgi:putative heme-binding domain-containing protein